jgi:catechol 2,3-dioxygenase-like lactoylglutathione lyase family enzyme
VDPWSTGDTIGLFEAGKERRAVEMRIDHVAMLVPDASRATAGWRRRHGFGSERGMFYERAGTRHWFVPLEPPQGLEVIAIEDREAAMRGPDGQAVLACEARGFGLFSWCVLVDDLDHVSKRLGIPIFDYTVPQPDGTLRGWRTVSGPSHLPFFIDYPNNGDREARLRAVYERVSHTSAPTVFSELTVSGTRDEHLEWLGAHDLPLRFKSGRLGVMEARIATRHGVAVIS